MFPKAGGNSCILYSLQHSQSLWLPCDNHHRNSIFPLGLLYDHGAGNNKYICKWRSRQTLQTRDPNTTKAHEDAETRKRDTCGGIHLWKPPILSRKKTHQIVAGARNDRHNPFPGHQGSHGGSESFLFARPGNSVENGTETLDGGRTVWNDVSKMWKQNQIPLKHPTSLGKMFCCPPKLIHFNKEHVNPCSDTDGRKEQPESLLESLPLRCLSSLQQPAKTDSSFDRRSPDHNWDEMICPGKLE